MGIALGSSAVRASLGVGPRGFAAGPAPNAAGDERRQQQHDQPPKPKHDRRKGFGQQSAVRSCQKNNHEKRDHGNDCKRRGEAQCCLQDSHALRRACLDASGLDTMLAIDLDVSWVVSG